MSSVASNVDLEEGEIEEDALEDISDCSLSEAIVVQKDLEHDSEVELLREEALKSLQEDDEVTEEELYRLEALKSLLTNIESSEKISPAEEVRKKKRKHKKRNRHRKSAKLVSDEVLETSACEKSLVEASDECISTSRVNSSSNMDFSDKENQTDRDINLVTRSWYPKTDFALLNLCSNETKQQPRKSCGNDDFIIIPRILSVANNDIKPTIRETIPARMPVNRSLKLNRVEMPTRAVPTMKVNCPVPPAAHLSRYKNVSKHHIQKYPVIQPTNRFSLRNVKRGKYKIVNKSCYSLKKSVNSSPAKTEKRNTLSKSVYSLNRVQNQPASSKHQFIIDFDEDESGKEDNGNVGKVEKPNLKRSPSKLKNLRSPSKLKNLNELPGSPSKLKNLNELPGSELPYRFVQAENGLERVADLPTSVVEKESNIDIFEISPAETVIEAFVDLPNDEVMPLLEVTTSVPSTTSCYDPSFPENEHTLPDTYSEEITDGTDVSMIPDAVTECHAVSSGACSDEKELLNETTSEISKMNSDKIEECDDSSSRLYPEDMNPSDVPEVSKITPGVDEECDVNVHTPCVIESDQLTEKPELLNIVACPEEEYKHFVIKEEPIDSESIEDSSMKDNTECEVTNDVEIDDCQNLTILQDVEADLIEIRARLLLNLDELEESMKKDELEREKLNTMLKKLLLWKSSIFKFENKIRAHQSKLSIHADTMEALFKDISDKTDSCVQMKDVCFRVGMEIMGPQYKPPDVYENAIDEKIKAIDFSKFIPDLE